MYRSRVFRPRSCETSYVEVDPGEEAGFLVVARIVVFAFRGREELGFGFDCPCKKRVKDSTISLRA